MNKKLSSSRPLVVSLALLGLTACSVGGANRTTTGTLGGAATGAGLGAIIGNQTGNPEVGVAIGSAAGAIVGALTGNKLDGVDAENQRAREKVAMQEAKLEENRKLIEALKRRGADVSETKRGVVVNLPDVLFQFDSDRLTREAELTLSDVSEVVRGTKRNISVEGHTDSIGTVVYNKDLSRRRANTVASGLRHRGVPASKISARGFGEGSPIASNNTDTGRARNRRVEVIIENQPRY